MATLQVFPTSGTVNGVSIDVEGSKTTGTVICAVLLLIFFLSLILAPNASQLPI